MVEFDIYDMIVFEGEDGSIQQDCVSVIDNVNQLILCWRFCIDIKTTKTQVYADIKGCRKWKIKEIWKRKDKDTYKRVYCLEEK